MNSSLEPPRTVVFATDKTVAPRTGGRGLKCIAT